jgi:hypothetical protein
MMMMKEYIFAVRMLFREMQAPPLAMLPMKTWPLS